MELEQIILTSCVTVIALGMFIVSLLSYRTYKNKKLLFVSLAVLVFLLKGILQSLYLFGIIEGLPVIYANPFTGLLDLIILVLLFAATLKR